MNKSAKNQDLFQDNKAIKVKYTTTKIKSRNFLSNVAHVAINKEDFYNKNFIFDVYLLVTKNLNLFSLDRNWLTKQSTKWSMFFGGNACRSNIISLFARKRTFFLPEWKEQPPTKSASNNSWIYWKRCEKLQVTSKQPCQIQKHFSVCVL